MACGVTAALRAAAAFLVSASLTFDAGVAGALELDVSFDFAADVAEFLVAEVAVFAVLTELDSQS